MWLRCTPEMEGFYAKWGFACANDGAHWLRKTEHEG
jgi:hypothetical protein